MRARLVQGLSDRDRLVLLRLAEHRYLTSRQLQAFAFTHHESAASAARVCRRVLARLADEGLIRSLPRRVGGLRAGSSATVWQLTPSGARLLDPEARSYRTHEPSFRFLGHCLAVADDRLALQNVVGCGDVEAVTVHVEPVCWRRFSGLGGETRWLQPDLSACIQGAAYEDRWFIETDCGTESLNTLLRKCRQYEDYRTSGQEQTEHGVFPLVVWIMHGSGSRGGERKHRLARSLGRSGTFTPGLFRVVLPDELPGLLLGTDEPSPGGQL